MVTRHSWRTVSPPVPESKTPTGRESMAAIVGWRDAATRPFLGSRLPCPSRNGLRLLEDRPAGADERRRPADDDVLRPGRPSARRRMAGGHAPARPRRDEKRPDERDRDVDQPDR